MKLFHISDVLSVTTGRLVSSRHMTGVYDILNFLTGDNLFTHQLPRAMKECEPRLRTQFPKLMEDDSTMADIYLPALDESLKEDRIVAAMGRETIIDQWVEGVRKATRLPLLVPVYELGADVHTHIDPIEELEAMVGKDKVIPIVVG